MIWLSGFAVFLGALLLFSVQPMAARSLLAWYGGAPMVWAVSLFFFQTALLVGYLYAHLLITRVPARWQLLVHGGLLVVAAGWNLPPFPDAGWAPGGGEAPAGWILLTLFATLGAAFVAAAATTPLVSAWLLRWRERRSGSGAGDFGIYRLYALSNVGSLLGLALYPAVLEPLFGLEGQTRLWSFGFVALALTAAGSGFLALRPHLLSSSRDDTQKQSTERVNFHRWPFALAAAGSLMLVAVTTHLTRDVASVPFLWAVPLALYLLTFVLAFRGGTPYPRRILLVLLFASVVVCLFVWFRDITYGLESALVTQVVSALAFLFLACWIVHGQIAERKPPASGLTGFYLSMTAGGALGGLLAALASPLVFPNIWEYPLALVLAAGAALFIHGPEAPLSFRQQSRTSQVAFASILVLTLAVTALEHRRPLFASRNFFGVVRVMEADPETPAWRRDLWHGGIAHGSQWLAEGRRREPTLYFYEGTGVEAALNRHPKRERGEPLRVAVIGLGAGSLVTYGQSGDLFRFYEIDPQVVAVAREFFAFLEDTPATVEIVTGDGRLGLERDAELPGFDVIVLDAFSGDAIPVHLLTAEAFDLYDARLAAGGVLALHISNRHVDLAPVVRAQALRLELLSLLTVSTPAPERFRYTATWALLSRNADFITDPSVLGRAEPWAGEAAEPEATFFWTDDYSNLLRVLR